MSTLRKILTMTALCAGVIQGAAQADVYRKEPQGAELETYVKNEMPSLFGINRAYSQKMFDRQEYVTDKPLQQLIARQTGELEDKKLYVGGRFIGSVMHERSNTTGKYPILSRLPPQHRARKSDTVDVINDASVNATVTLPYVTAFIQGEYTDVEYPGQDQKQWRKYWVTVGDLNKFPVYATVGKNTVAFGDMVSYAPFTHSHNTHYFWAQSDQPSLEVGYYQNGTHVAATLIENDRGLRVVNAPDGDAYENFAVNVSQVVDLTDDLKAKIGGGFLRGTIYDSTLAHHPPTAGLQDKDWSPAWNINGTLSYKNVDLQAEYTQTVDEWPSTNAKVHALTLQGRYKDSILGHPTNYSIMLSEGVQGEDGDEWQRMAQGVLGVETNLTPNISIGVEYVANVGFVPLILPTVTADDGVVSHTFIVGTKVTF
jgi:hypothetical protein